MRDQILQSVNDAIRAAETLKSPQAIKFMEQVALALADAYKQGGKVLVAGNGGSLCDADHFAEELTGLFRSKRPALAAISLSNPGHLSCVANDMGFEEVFARGVEALGNPGDVLVLLTTSGNSENLVRACRVATQKGLKVVALLGKTGGRLKGQADYELVIEGFTYSDRVQEAHMAILHILTELVEQQLFVECSLSLSS